MITESDVHIEDEIAAADVSAEEYWDNQVAS